MNGNAALPPTPFRASENHSLFDWSCGFAMRFSFSSKSRSDSLHSKALAAALNLSNWVWFFFMYRLYVDETGHDQVKTMRKDAQIFLSLTGVAVKHDHMRDVLIPNMDWIKAKVFEHDPDAPMVFHRKDIRGFKGLYVKLKDAERKALYDKAMLRLFSRTEYVVITALIDKQWMLRQDSWSNKHPYHYLMEILVEKYALLLKRKQDIGDIFVEARGPKQNKSLNEAYEEFRMSGTYYVNATDIQSRLRAKSLKFRSKSDNCAGLQLCDLVAHPSHIYIRELMGHDVSLGPFADQIVKILLQGKYDRSGSGKIYGYGIKHYPS